jgi:hypothetical protein
MLEQIPQTLAQGIMRNAPRERDPRYFRTWQQVSLALQRALREWIPEMHFRDAARFEDRCAAFQVLAYSAARLCYGRPKAEFTFDAGDPRTIESALHNVGVALKLALEPVEQRLRAAGRIELSRRYASAWRQDILRQVRQNSRIFTALLGAESKLIDAVIDLGTSGDIPRFARLSNAATRKILGQDMRSVIVPCLEDAARVVREQAASGLDRPAGFGPHQHLDMAGPRSPDLGIGGEEDRDHGHTDRCGEVRDPRIVSDINARSRKPAGQLVEVVVADGSFEGIVGPGDPSDGNAQPLGDGTEIFERPVFAGTP